MEVCSVDVRFSAAPLHARDSRDVLYLLVCNSGEPTLTLGFDAFGIGNLRACLYTVDELKRGYRKLIGTTT